MRFLPGKPWIILIALIGNIYGIFVNNAGGSLRPLLLLDKYPEMNKYGADIMNFGYLSAPFADDSKITLKGVFFGSLKVAFVAVLETLISARIADTKTGTRFDESKETLGMGLGNVLSGFFGGTPCTGVLVRTGVNIASGATDKIS
jgi:MFS superfamily sulfate permease-like transporter